MNAKQVGWLLFSVTLIVLMWVATVQGLIALAHQVGAHQAIAYIEQAQVYFYIAMGIFYLTLFYYIISIKKNDNG